MRAGIGSRAPLAIYFTGPTLQKCRYIDNIVVENRLRALAKTTYEISDNDDLQKYTCKSLQVGTCVLLHTAQANQDTIQLRLRWRSDSYKIYLRDTVRLASAHNIAMNSTDPDLSELKQVRNMAEKKKSFKNT